MNKFRLWIKQKRCKHYQADLIKWHWLHENGMEPRKIEAKYKCLNCGKTVFLHLSERESNDFAYVMEHHRQDGFDNHELGGDT